MIVTKAAERKSVDLFVNNLAEKPATKQFGHCDLIH